MQNTMVPGKEGAAGERMKIKTGYFFKQNTMVVGWKKN